jgi:hypothetical protein
LVGAGAGRPLVEVGLRAAGQREAACGEPGQERHGGGDAPARDGGLVAGGGGAAGPGTQPPEHVPDRVAVQQLPLGRVGAGRDHLGRPPFELGEVFVAGG